MIALPLVPPAQVQFVAAVGNVRHNEPKWDRISDIGALADMLPGSLPWIVAGAEIDNHVSRVAWTSLLGGTHVGLATETPIAVSRDWTLIGHRVHVVTQGIPGVDPARETVVAKVRDDASGIKVAVLAEHKDHLAFGPGRNEESRRGWFEQWHATRALAHRLRLLGYVVVVEEDGNHGGGPIRYARDQIVAACSGLMQITILRPLGVLGAGVRVAVGRVRSAWTRQGIHTDHPLLAVPITITKG